VIATPFVQGRLRSEKLSFSVQTECGHCGEPLHLEIDSEMNYRVLEDGAAPLVYAPLLDVTQLKDPSIIDGF
jgi:hypothetical protein